MGLFSQKPNTGRLRGESAENPGLRLKRRRDELGLTYRDVEEASKKIAQRHDSDEYLIGLSRLADIENKGVVPSIYRLYSLCAIYHLDPVEAIEWYGIDLSMFEGDSLTIDIPRTHLVQAGAYRGGDVTLPLSLDPGVDPRKTYYLSHHIGRWGKLPLMLLNAFDVRSWRYAWVGTDDWSMYPVLHPGSLLLIDETKKKIQSAGWRSDYERPIYLVEHRSGYAVGWCSLNEGMLVVQPHPASDWPTRIYKFNGEAEIVGTVAGVAMHFERRPPADR
ncbi:MAG TPA: helix-turn-helix transcriptional regulator [Bryobacteraceae bacterium]|nr:helix-turn-helix transcriptional regulator [Bryobacteraceae bacterium]